MSNPRLTKLLQMKIHRQNLLARISIMNRVTWLHLKQWSSLSQGRQKCFLGGHRIDLFNSERSSALGKGRGILHSFPCSVTSSLTAAGARAWGRISPPPLPPPPTRSALAFTCNCDGLGWTVLARHHALHRGLPWASLSFWAQTGHVFPWRLLPWIDLSSSTSPD